MANKKISELPYINGGQISGNTLIPLVTYFSAVTGDTVHTYVSDLKNYLTSGLTGNTNVLVTGGTYSAGTITFTNSTGGTFNVTGLTTGSTSTISGNYLPLSGGTVTGGTIFQSGLTATTISATTYQNLPKDIRVTGGTYSNGTATFINNTGGTFNVTGLFTGTTKYFGSFYDTQDQTGITGTVLTMSASTANTFNNGITLRETSKFGIENSGLYNLSFSAQMFKVTGNSSTKAFIWLSQNGTDVPISTRQITFPLEGLYVVAAWNFFFETTTPREYVELKWKIVSDVNNSLIIKYVNDDKSVPEIPSLIVTINQVN